MSWHKVDRDTQGSQTGQGDFPWGDIQDGGGTRPIVQIPHVTCTNQPPLWKPAQGTEGGRVLSFVCTPTSEVFRAPPGEWEGRETRGTRQQDSPHCPLCWAAPAPNLSPWGQEGVVIQVPAGSLVGGRGGAAIALRTVSEIWISPGIPAHSSASIVVSMTLRGGYLSQTSGQDTAEPSAGRQVWGPYRAMLVLGRLGNPGPASPQSQ